MNMDGEYLTPARHDIERTPEACPRVVPPWSLNSLDIDPWLRLEIAWNQRHGVPEHWPGELIEEMEEGC